MEADYSMRQWQDQVSRVTGKLGGFLASATSPENPSCRFSHHLLNSGRIVAKPEIISQLTHSRLSHKPTEEHRCVFA
jgi:hypothetical protein